MLRVTCCGSDPGAGAGGRQGQAGVGQHSCRATVPRLLIEMRVGVAERFGGDLEQAVEGRIHL